MLTVSCLVLFIKELERPVTEKLNKTHYINDYYQNMEL